jgi:AraC-like DNA-binding protein
MPASSRLPAAGTAKVTEFSTQGIAPAERLAYWRASVLRRMEPVVQPGDFSGRLRMVGGAGAMLMEHSTGAIEAERSALRCRRDDGDEISIDLMIACRRAVLQHRGTLQLRPGDMCVVDYAQPNRVVRSEHRAAALMLPRALVRDALGADPAALAGCRLAGGGIGSVLRSQMRATINAAPLLTPAQMESAMVAAVSLAPAALQVMRPGTADVLPGRAGLHRAAHLLIAQTCTDPELTPERMAQTLGCSRATLYRAFGESGEGVAAIIWSARLDHASGLLCAGGDGILSIAEVAWCSGFSDSATFDRMFRRRFGMTPRDARAGGQRIAVS